MKIKNIFLILVLILISSCSRKGESLKLILEVPQKEYRSGDDILVRVTLKNISEEPILVDGRLCLGPPGDPITSVALKITTPDGQEVPTYVRISVNLPKDSDFVLLKPGDTIDGDILINILYGDFNDIGTYSIQAYYHNRLDPKNGETAWKGQIESDMNNFVIVP